MWKASFLCSSRIWFAFEYIFEICLDAKFEISFRNPLIGCQCFDFVCPKPPSVRPNWRTRSNFVRPESRSVRPGRNDALWIQRMFAACMFLVYLCAYCVVLCCVCVLAYVCCACVCACMRACVRARARFGGGGGECYTQHTFQHRMLSTFHYFINQYNYWPVDWWIVFMAGNKLGEKGVEAFLIAIQRQTELTTGSNKPHGLLRLSLMVSTRWLN